MFTQVTSAPNSTRCERAAIARVPMLRLRPLGICSDATLIYLHGGAYALDSTKGYRDPQSISGRLKAAATVYRKEVDILTATT